MILRLSIILSFLQYQKCSYVIDSAGQRGIYLSEYCPKMKHCEEGTHVMCMHYNPKHTFGPKCINPRNISMTPEFAEILLSVSNAIRAKISRGVEKGKDGTLLPRGYGMFKLKWDEELATFAQVLANQCVLRHDYCRATKKFPDPGQTAGLVRFSFPAWEKMNRGTMVPNKFKSGPGLTDEKIKYALTQSLKSWYTRKQHITTAIIANYPDWNKNISQIEGRLYLEMIHGPATHMGCGISAYSEYAFYENRGDLNFNSVQVMCNYSAKPNKDRPVYNTLGPSDKDVPFSKCGCPVGSRPDEDCLCIEKPETGPFTLQNKKGCKGPGCDTTVVLLPIFTTEDAPPEKLVHLNNYNNSMRTLNEEDDLFSDIEHGTILKNKDTSNLRRPANPKPNRYVVKKRYFGKNGIESKTKEKYVKKQEHVPFKKMSLFARATTFRLPNSRIKTQQPTTKSLKRDVVIRRDFSSAKKLADKYIYGKKSLIKKAVGDNMLNAFIGDKSNILMMPVHPKVKHIHDAEPIHDYFDKHHTIDIKTQDNAENKSIYLQNMDRPGLDSIDNATFSSDNKLLNLLDTLEQEVKNIELRGPDKEIFDAKIRNIYGKVVGQPPTSLNLKLKIPAKTDTKRVKKIIEDHLLNLNDGKVKILAGSETSQPPPTPRESSFENYQNTHPTKENLLSDDASNNRVRSIYLNNNIDAKPYDNPRSLRKHKSFNSFEEKRDREREYSQRESINEHQYRSKRPYKSERFEKKHYREREMNGREERGREMDDLDRRDKRHRNYISERGPGEALSVERRKYYQDKLDNIERRINRVRNHKRRRFQAPGSRHMRAMVPGERKSENQIDPFYVPDRARILHGY